MRHSPSDVRMLEAYVYALGGIPLGLYLLWGGEFLGALVFLGIGAGCLLSVLDDHIPHLMPRCTLKLILWCFGVSMVALLAVVTRASMQSPR